MTQFDVAPVDEFPPGSVKLVVYKLDYTIEFELKNTDLVAGNSPSARLGFENQHPPDVKLLGGLFNNHPEYENLFKDYLSETKLSQIPVIDSKPEKLDGICNIGRQGMDKLFHFIWSKGHPHVE